MDLGAVILVRNQLIEHDFDYFIFGGWAVDILSKKISRRHLDINLVIWGKDRNRFMRYLKSHKYKIEEEDVKIVFYIDKVKHEVVFLYEEGDICIFEDKNFFAEIPKELLVPFQKARFLREDFNIGLKELIVKMTLMWGFHMSDVDAVEALNYGDHVLDRINLRNKEF